MSPKPLTDNTLFYGDNLPILREHVSDESVNLIYLDPPFNSSRSYNVLFREEGGQESQAQITAFEDTWHRRKGGPSATGRLFLSLKSKRAKVSAWRSRYQLGSGFPSGWLCS
jgi:adenine specific DNA methylase Mod